MGVVTYAGELMVSLQYDRAQVDKRAAQELLHHFARQLSVSAGVVSENLQPMAEHVPRAAELCQPAGRHD